MSSRSLERIRRSLTFRLNLWYAILFIGSTVVLYLLTYALLYATVGKKDRELVESQIKEYVLIYADRGLRGLRDYLQAESLRGGRVPYVRFTGLPGRYRREVWLRVPRDAERDLVYRVAQLADGSWI